MKIPFMVVSVMLFSVLASAKIVTINCYDGNGAPRIRFEVDSSSGVYNPNDIKMFGDGEPIQFGQGPFEDAGPFLGGVVEGKGSYSAQLQLKLNGGWTSRKSSDLRNEIGTTYLNGKKIDELVLTKVAGVPMELKCASVRDEELSAY